MIDFVVSVKEFKKAGKLILSGRKGHMDTDSAEFAVGGDSLALSSVGSETEVEPEVAEGGDGCAGVAGKSVFCRVFPS